MDRYAFDNVWNHARERLRGLEQLLDPGTIQHLEALGVREGWYCLEVGAGGGTITEWLCHRVGPSGRVVATDLDTRFLETLNKPNLEVRRHNIVSDSILEGQFDLVLSRLVLEHIQTREDALRRMLSALKPRGWLVCEDADNTSVALLCPQDTASTDLFMKVERGKDNVMNARGHTYCGRQLFGWLYALGLIDIGTDARVPLLYGATAPARWKQLSVEQLGKDIANAKMATEAEIAAYLALLDSPSFVARGFTVVTAWGRPPA